MNQAFAPLLAQLRSARAEQAFGRAVAGVREWRNEMAWSAPALPVCEALPPEADLQALLDPLADSALASVHMPAPDNAKAASVALPRRGMPSVRKPALAAASSRSGAGEATQVRAVPAPQSAIETAARERSVSPSRVVAWLARHEHLRPPPADVALQRIDGVGSNTRDRKVVRLPLRPAPDEVSRKAIAGAATPAVASAVTRWQEAHARAPGQRAWMATLAEAAARATAPAAMRSAPTAPGASPRPSFAAEAGLSMAAGLSAAAELSAVADVTRRGAASTPVPERSLRLRDLAQTRPASPALPASEGAPGSESVASRDATPEPAAQRHPLAAIGESLSRIEKRLGAPTPQRELTQWLDDDDRLAERIHALLRQQAKRHGIGTP